MNKIKRATIEIFAFAIIGLVCMGSMFYLEGPQGSISMYSQYTTTAYIFKLWMLSLALGALRNRTLQYALVPAIFLAVFDSNDYDQIINWFHNIAAFAFFGITTISFLVKKETKLTGIFLLLSFVFYPIFNLYIGEIISVTILYVHFISKVVRLNINVLKNV